MASQSRLSTFRSTPESQVARRPSATPKETIFDEDEREDDSSDDESSSDSDRDLEQIAGFDDTGARNQLINFKECYRIGLSLEQQKDLGLVIGINVTAEYPWKQLKKQIISDYLIGEKEEITELRQKIANRNDEDLLLVGYAPTLSEDEDMFMFFENEKTTKLAYELIEKLEAFERIKAKHMLIKRPRPWRSLGSEKEVEHFIQKPRTNVVDVEFQSIYPINHPYEPFTFRKVEDVRDGYVELLPGKNKFKTINRRRIDASIQSAAPRIDLEQQTEPTFPTNAWSHYLYEIKNEDEETEIEDENDGKKKRKAVAAEPEEVILPSDRVGELLKALDFNQINMYRNDYPEIAKREFPKYHAPYLKEVFCFANISKTIGRYICHIDWHPTYSGLLVASYTFGTLGSSIDNDDPTDPIRRTVLSANPVIMWCFDDTLDSKLEFQCQREITRLSFCPYDENLLLGGTVNGQILIWDIKNCISRVETEEFLTQAQQRHRISMRSFLAFTKVINQEKIVRPAATSPLEFSQKNAITGIYWFDRKYYVTTSGLVRENPQETFRFFMTSSMDGTIAIWDLDSSQLSDVKKKEARRKRELPECMIKETSPYEQLNRIIRPIYLLIFKYPITSLLMNDAIFRYEPIPTSRKPKIYNRVVHRIVEQRREEFHNQMTITSYLAHMASITWEGIDASQSNDIVKEKIIQPEHYAYIHDGPILHLDRNPFVPEIILSIGQNIFAIWKKDLYWTPFFWRRRPAKLTSGGWNKNRPSVFHLTREDGTLEIWDLLTRTDDPALIENLGGSILTIASQHKLTLPQEAISIGDYNSSLRFLLLPSAFTTPLENEVEILLKFLDREMQRKTRLKEWQDKYYEANTDIREAKRKLAEEAELELLRLEKEQKEKEELQMRREAEEQRKAELRSKSKLIFDLPERLAKKWDEMNIKRLMKNLMAMRHIDPEQLQILTKPEKDRIAYNEQKRKAIAESFKRVNEEVSKIRSRILPTEEQAEDRLHFVRECVETIPIEDFSTAQADALKYIQVNKNERNLTFAEFLAKGQERREKINRALGKNLEHIRTYEKLKTQWQYNFDVDHISESSYVVEKA